ncbi:unnamed protein product, partial [marine sediment metagenome]
AEMALTVALVQGVTATVTVGPSNIPAGTPPTGWIRVERDSDNNMDLIAYSAWENTGGTFTLVGTAPSAAQIGNDVMRSLVDEERTSAGTSSYQAVYVATPVQVAITVRNGYTAAKNGPIDPFKTTATWGAGGFQVKANRADDS